MIGLSETRFDLKFHLLGVPVRVHPAFWVVSAIMGWRENELPLVALWIACVFVSIIVHEFGHALMSRRFDASPSVVLWGMGGLCHSQGEQQTPLQRLAVVLAGPGAGFLFCAVRDVSDHTDIPHHAARARAMIGSMVGLNPLPEGVPIKVAMGITHFGATVFTLYTYDFLIQINFLWSVLNLLPVWPLDGGQATQILLKLYDRFRGERWSHVVSLLVAGVVAVVAYSLTQRVFMAVFFAYFAWSIIRCSRHFTRLIRWVSIKKTTGGGGSAGLLEDACGGVRRRQHPRAVGPRNLGDTMKGVRSPLPFQASNHNHGRFRRAWHPRPRVFRHHLSIFRPSRSFFRKSPCLHEKAERGIPSARRATRWVEARGAWVERPAIRDSSLS